MSLNNKLTKLPMSEGKKKTQVLVLLLVLVPV